MRKAVIIDGRVTNIILADADFEVPGATLVPAPPEVAIGDTWDGAVFARPPAPAVTVPEAVTMRQARLALLGAGLLGQVESAINALPEPDQSAARIAWEYSGEVQRHFGLVAQLAPALGLTDAQVDDLFVAAATL